jgi:hypothetical protein
MFESIALFILLTIMFSVATFVVLKTLFCLTKIVLLTIKAKMQNDITESLPTK